MRFATVILALALAAFNLRAGALETPEHGAAAALGTADPPSDAVKPEPHSAGPIGIHIAVYDPVNDKIIGVTLRYKETFETIAACRAFLKTDAFVKSFSRLTRQLVQSYGQLVLTFGNCELDSPGADL